jgi:hypothetical protein
VGDLGAGALGDEADDVLHAGDRTRCR